VPGEPLSDFCFAVLAAHEAIPARHRDVARRAASSISIRTRRRGAHAAAWRQPARGDAGCPRLNCSPPRRAPTLRKPARSAFLTACAPSCAARHGARRVVAAEPAQFCSACPPAAPLRHCASSADRRAHRRVVLAPQHVLCCPQDAPRRAFSRPPRPPLTPTSLFALGGAVRSALGVAVRRLQLVPGHRCTQQPRALRASAAGNARRAPCKHNDAWRRGAKVARRRGATHAQPQGRVLY
jgi:hypothetical protein